MKKFTVESWREEIQSLDIWELPYQDDDFDEDNDTSEEEDEVDEDLPKTIQNKNSSSSSLNRISDDLEDPKKGFKYFIDQEIRVLEKLKEKAERQKQNHIEEPEIAIISKVEELSTRVNTKEEIKEYVMDKSEKKD